ncbi:MAG: cation diffusion facilitator family transporter [Bifidobacteriaceae bacterium]|nr:cation diffusion facilitator family transporter [Bifidobacteriaceae bacterium]
MTEQQSSDSDVKDDSGVPSAQGAPVDKGSSHVRRLGVTLSLTATVLVAEVVGAILTGSLALLVDAGHMLTDVAVLTASVTAAVLMRRKPTATRTWGWDRLEVVTAAGSAAALLLVGLYALVMAVRRLFFAPDAIEDLPLLLGFGILGLATNVISIVLLASDRGDNLNMRAAFLEVLNDALGSVAVIVGAVVMLITGWSGADSVAGALIALLMVPRAFKLLHRSVKVLLLEVPSGLDLEEVRGHLQRVPGVESVHDLHASTVRTGLVTLSAHVVVEKGLTPEQSAGVLAAMQKCVREHFPVSVDHTTFQIEPEGYNSSHRENVHV